MSIRRRIVSLAVCLAVALLMAPAIARAAEPEQGTYLALGDSITSGYGLDAEAGERSFAELVAKDEGLALDDSYASDQGLTSSDLRALLTDEAFQRSVADASLISVTIGGNDVMNALYDYLANAWSVANPDGAMSAEDVRSLLENGTTAEKSALLELGAQVLPDFFTSSEAQSALVSLSDNLAEVVSAVKGLNPDAPLVILNQYNPYAHLGAAASLPQVEAIVAAFEGGVQTLNATIAQGAATGGYVVADAYSALAAAGRNPCNASVSLVEVNLDFHPNAYGHELIAGAVLEALNPASSFDDISTDDWYYDAVNWAVMRGYLTGYADGSNRFGANDDLVRAQFGEILYRAFAATSGVEADPSVLGNYTDLDPNKWYSASMPWAICSGLLKGYEGTSLMGPDDPLSREMVAEILMRMAQLSGADVSGRADLSSFTDADQVSPWFSESVSWAVHAGIIGGVEAEDGSLSLIPRETCSRAQMATILMRWLAAE